MVYLISSQKPAAEILAPKEPQAFERMFAVHFQGMTREPVSSTSLLEVRARLLRRISELLDARSRAFLESVEREAPDFDLIELPNAAELPGVRRKLANLGQRSAAKRAADHRQLEVHMSGGPPIPTQSTLSHLNRLLSRVLRVAPHRYSQTYR